MYEIKKNETYNSLEVYFDRIPSVETRTALKGLKFKWHSQKKCWYGFASEADVIAAIDPAAAPVDEPQANEPAAPVEPVVKTSYAFPRIDEAFADVILAIGLIKAGQNDAAIDKLDSLGSRLGQQINEAVIKAQGDKPRLKAMERIVKAAQHTPPQYHGTFESDGCRVVCDGHRLVAISNEAVPMPAPAEVTAETISVNKIIPSIDGAQALELPELGTLKALVKAKLEEQKNNGVKARERKAIWIFKTLAGLGAVDAQYLIDMIEAMPNYRAYCPGKNRGIVFTNEDGRAFLLPIRIESVKADSTALINPEIFSEAQAA